MFKNWSKIVLVSVLVLALGVTAVFGSTARWRSLAYTADYISDDSSVYRWYSLLSSYANMVQAEMGTWHDSDYLDEDYSNVWDPEDFMSPIHGRALSVNYALGEDGSMGVARFSLHEGSVDHPGPYMGNPLMWATPDMVGSSIQNGFGNWSPGVQFDIAWGYDASEDFAIGLAITRSSFSWKATSEIGEDEMTRTFTTIGGGVSLSAGENAVVDIAATYGKAGGEDIFNFGSPGSVTTETQEFDKSSALNIAARMFYEWLDDVTIVAVADLTSAEYSTVGSMVDVDEPEGDKISYFMFGVGANVEVNSSNLLHFSVEVAQGKWEPSVMRDTPLDFDEVEIKHSYLPRFRLALESEVKSWLTTRVGAMKTVGKIEVDYQNGDSEEATLSYLAHDNGYLEYADFLWTLGLGFNVGEWTIDMEVAETLPFSMGYWLTGYTAYSGDDRESRDVYGPVRRVSATYNF